MKRTIVLTITVLAILALVIISFYSTFAYNEEASKLGDSIANYNLIYSLSESTDNETIIASGQEKYIDLKIKNTYDSIVQYGIYYEMLNPKTVPDGLEIKPIENAQTIDILKPNEERTIPLRIKNTSDYSVSLIIGSMIGFENGNVLDLINDNKILIK